MSLLKPCDCGQNGNVFVPECVFYAFFFCTAFVFSTLLLPGEAQTPYQPASLNPRLPQRTRASKPTDAAVVHMSPSAQTHL